MTNLKARSLLAANLCLLLVTAPSDAADVTTAPVADSVRLELETDALSTLNDLQVDTAEITALKKLSADTKGKPDVSSAQYTPGYVAALTKLKSALVGGNADAVEAAEDAVSTAEDQSDKDLGVDVQISAAARSKADAAMKLFSPGQLANYAGAVADEMPDMPRVLVELVDESHEASTDFDEDREDTIEQARILALGANTDKTSPFVQKVRKFLDRVKQTSATEFSAKRSDLENEAKELGKSLDPFPCVRRWIEHDLAELLSNPELGTALAELPPATPANSNDGN